MPILDKNKQPKIYTLDNLVDYLSVHADKTAILTFTDTGIETWSYAELAESVNHLARGLVTAGVARNETVALLATERPEWILACLAIIKAGATTLPLDVQLDDDTLAFMLKNSGARFVFTSTDKIDLLQQLNAGLKLVLLDKERDSDRSWHQLLITNNVELPKIEPGDRAALFYTSGTTGRPKGVPLTHANITFQINTILDTGLMNTEDRVVLPLPLHHAYPFVMGMLTPLAIGLPLILPNTLTGPQILRALREGSATVMVGVPRLYTAMLDGIRAQLSSRGLLAAAYFKACLGLSQWLRRYLGLYLGKILLYPLHKKLAPHLRTLACGGAALDLATARNLEGLGWRLAIGYGLTETAPLLTMNLPGSSQLDSPGRAAPGVELRIDTTALADGSVQTQGEILARGPNVFSGYLNLPAETREAFTPDGWFRTGDLGYIDDDGFLHITGRLKELIVTAGGENIQPEEVERNYVAHPFIHEFALFQQDGRLVALIIPESGEIRRSGHREIKPAIRSVVADIMAKLPSYQRITDYVISHDPLPHTRLGKTRRHLLPVLYEQAKALDAGLVQPGLIPLEQMTVLDRALLTHPAAQQIWDWLPGRFPKHRLTPDTSLQLELGVDSLEWIGLTLEIKQRTGVELDEDAIGRIETVRNLLQEVTEMQKEGHKAIHSLSLENPEAMLNQEQARWLRPLPKVAAAIATLIYALILLLFRALFRLQVHGREHLPTQSQFVLIPNHTSFLDPFTLAAALNTRTLRQIYWAGLTDIAFSNFVTRLVSRLGQILPIDPIRSAVSSLALGATILKRGRHLVWFPEGGRSPGGGLLSFRPGIGMLLEHYPVTVVPVCILGAHEAMPMGSKWPRFFRPITVVFGKPLNPRELAQQGEGETDAVRIVDALHNKVAELCQEKKFQ